MHIEIPGLLNKTFYIFSGIPCSHCSQCMAGRYHLCPTVVFKSTPPYDGLLAKYITHPARWLHK